MASIRKLRGKWQAIVRRKGAPQFSKTFELQADAKNWARSLERELDLGHDLTAHEKQRDTTLRQLLERYRDEVTPTKKSHRQEKCRINRLLDEPFASYSLNRLTPSMFATFRDKRLKTVGNQAVRHDLIILGRVIKTAKLEWGISLDRNPLGDVRKPPVANSRERRLSGDEVARLLGALPKTRNGVFAPLVRFAMETGMRRGEMLRLKPADCDLESCQLKIREAKNGFPRTIPLSRAAIEILRDRIEAGDDFIFPITEPTVRHAWEHLCSRAGIRDFHFHDLRHEAVSRLFEKGLSVPEVALISGHRDYRMLARYTHMNPEAIVPKLG